jgi:hypothetical protein
MGKSSGKSSLIISRQLLFDARVPRAASLLHPVCKTNNCGHDKTWRDSFGDDWPARLVSPPLIRDPHSYSSSSERIDALQVLVA